MYACPKHMEALMPNGVYRDSGGWVQVNYEGRFRIPMHRSVYDDHDFKPKFAKRYGEIGTAVVDALRAFDSDVREGKFPDAEHSFTMKESELTALRQNAARPKAV